MIADVWTQLRYNKGAMAGLFVVVLFSLAAIFADVIAPYEPSAVISEQLSLPPIWGEGAVGQHILGTDDLGRDFFSRLVHGARVSLMIGLFVVVFSMFVGTLLGLLAGSLGGWIDVIIMRFMDIMMALPSVLLAIVVVSILGPSMTNTIIAVGVISIPHFVRVVRGAVLSEMQKNYVIATKAYGGSWFRVAVVNVLPNATAPIIVQATLGFSDGILSAAALGFLGLGAQPPIPEWGTMLSDGRSFIESAPWLVTLPGLCILAIVLAFNLLGDGLRDALDPKLRR